MYKAALFSPDGEDYVTDCQAETVEDVWECVNDLGSRWFFYPIAVIIRDHGSLTTGTQRIVDAPELFAHLSGHTLRVAGRMLAAEPEYVAAVLA